MTVQTLPLETLGGRDPEKTKTDLKNNSVITNVAFPLRFILTLLFVLVVVVVLLSQLFVGGLP